MSCNSSPFLFVVFLSDVISIERGGNARGGEREIYAHASWECLVYRSPTIVR
jgi:hypothetical protein